VRAPDGMADGFLTRPAVSVPHTAVLLYMDAYGIRPALEAHAQLLASHGYCVFVPNVFYRHGLSPVIENIEQLIGGSDRAALFAQLGPMMKALTPEATLADSQAWLAFLRDREDVREGPIGTVGYCMGGRLSLRMAGEFADTVAASFHGGNLATGEDDSPHRWIPTRWGALPKLSAKPTFGIPQSATSALSTGGRRPTPPRTTHLGPAPLDAPGRALRPRALVQRRGHPRQLAADDQPLNLGRAVDHLQHLRQRDQPRERRVLQPAVGPEHLAARDGGP
jgi:dienelactone hydrolase